MDDDLLPTSLLVVSQAFSGRKRPWPFRRISLYPLFLLLVMMLKSAYNFHPKPRRYELWIERYLDVDFFRLFRVTKSTCDELVHLLTTEGQLSVVWTVGKEPVKPEKMVQVALRYLSSQQTMRQIGDVFDLADSTIYVIREKVCRALIRILPKIIKWPSQLDAQVISAKFKSLAGFPNVIGAIDCSHIPCKVKEEISDDYLNRKMFHSVVLQGVCTSDKLFINVSAGYPGRMHDSKVLRWTKLFSKIENEGPSSLFYDDYHLIGDSAYVTKSWILTPFKAMRPLTRKQKNYNYLHSKTRVQIENAFGLLKSRWQRLQHVNVYNITTVTTITMACCVLHNFCLLQEDFFEAMLQNECDDDDDDGDLGLLHAGERNDQQGLMKRDTIADELAELSNLVV